MGEMSSIEMDVFKEIGNIGAGNATTALATLINAKIDMKEPKAEMIHFSELSSAIGYEENLIVAVMVTLSEDVQGMMMFMADIHSAKFLVGEMAKGYGMEMPEDTGEGFDEMQVSMISEIGNIICGSYLTALSGILSMKIDMSIPYVSIDMAGAILSVPAIEFGRVGDSVLMIQTDFGDDMDINGYFILIPDLESYAKILHTLGM
jgi:chemotaxis protein CheC